MCVHFFITGIHAQIIRAAELVISVFVGFVHEKKSGSRH
jgi:hypothetical protein